MSLKYECDSCGALAHPSPSRGPLIPPEYWTHITVGGDHGGHELDLCPDCATMPMRFGSTTLELTPPPRPRAVR